ncbi:MAG: phenylalanine--tRNA ligase subunit alpha [Candidatus Nealsonbacteria bacterium]
MKKINLKNIEKRAEKEIKKSQNLTELNDVYKQYLGKKGELSLVLRSLKKMPKKKRVKVGKEANKLKAVLEEKIVKKSLKIKEKAGVRREKEEFFDITIPGKKPAVGHLHPLTQTKIEIEKIFQSMGFSIIEGPELENEWYNFDALNFPKNHPARDMQDSLFIKQKNRENLPSRNKFLMRTQTSSMQVRFMEKNQPPLRIIIPGRVFRHEASDARHEINFYHIEGLMVGKEVSVVNFKAIIEESLKRFFKRNVKIRLRPSYFPFTEPSFEIDCSCPMCGGKGCSTCGGSGRLELMGAGMVHPNVFKNSGLSPKDWQGFAFGVGMDRLAMIKYKINDIRLFYGGDLRLLKQF